MGTSLIHSQWASPLVLVNGTHLVPSPGVTCPSPYPHSPLSPAVRCPAPVSFENGMYTPRLGSHPVGGNLSFQCEDGFVLRGSPVRQCRPNGMWDGETAVCDNGGECPD